MHILPVSVLFVIELWNLTVCNLANLLEVTRLAPANDSSHKRSITINDFEQLRVIGRGGFSRVILARKKDTGRLYAIKIIKKDHLKTNN